MRAQARKRVVEMQRAWGLLGGVAVADGIGFSVNAVGLGGGVED